MIKGTSFQAAYEACISNDVVFFLFLISQVGESVDDNTKNEVEYDNDNSEVEKHIIHHTYHKLIVIFAQVSEKVSNAAAIT